ncbi:hypothetical protein NMY22_g18917 [Coprinellus aureogranulatus]|nr:hypothetical protein NMY22_g18917 [Coprinellus aureogranulatus]
MAPNGWTTPEERDFLKSLIPNYESCQVKRRYKAFWQHLFKEYFTKFPLVDRLFPGSKLSALNETQKAEYSAALAKQQKVMFLNPMVEEEKKIRCETEGIKGRQQITVWHEVAKDMYRNATPEELAAVKKELEEGEVSEDDESLESPATYLHYLKKLPSLLDAAVTPAVRKAGVLAFITIVGPDPEQNGKIVTRTFQFGDKSTTPVFTKVWRDHDTLYIEELARFARRHEFTPEICAARSIHSANQTSKVPSSTGDAETTGETTPAASTKSEGESNADAIEQGKPATTPTQIPAPTRSVSDAKNDPDDKDSTDHLRFSRPRAKVSRVVSDEEEEEEEDDDGEDEYVIVQDDLKADRDSITLKDDNWDDFDSDTWDLNVIDPAMRELERQHRGPPHVFEINMAPSPASI